MNRKPDPAAPDAQPLSLKRWSQRKLASRRAEQNGAAEPVALPAAPSAATAQTPAGAGTDAPVALPPIESLTPESDFTAFFSAKAPPDDAVKRAALKVLLRDPRFNVMDGLDTYIDDYTREDPIPESVLRRMVQAQQFLAPEHREVPPTAQLDGVDTPTARSADAAAEAAQIDPPTSQPAVDPTVHVQDSPQTAIALPFAASSDEWQESPQRGIPAAPPAAETTDAAKDSRDSDPPPAARSGTP
jgi:hypothetical protein